MKLQQLLAASRTVTRRTDPRRRKYILQRLARERQTIEVTYAAYYLATGATPRKLWSDG